MTLDLFGIAIAGLAALLLIGELIGWFRDKFGRGEIDPQYYVDGEPVENIHVELSPAQVREIESNMERDRR